MKNLGIASVVLVGATLFAHFSSGQETRVQPGQRFKSPDGRFIAQCNGGGVVPTVDEITIVDGNTGIAYATISVLSPVYSVGWVGDSQTLVTVGHIAGGTQAEVIHMEEGSWKLHSAGPREGNKYRVVREILRHHAVELTYEIDAGRKGSGRLYLYNFLFHPDTRTHTNEKREDIGSEVYTQLQLQTQFDFSKP